MIVELRDADALTVYVRILLESFWLIEYISLLFDICKIKVMKIYLNR